MNPPAHIRHRAGRLLLAAAAAAILTLTSACKETGDIQVKDITFAGVHAFPVSDLTSVLATRESGWLPWSAKHYFDRAEFDADLDRIRAFYADHGYPDAAIVEVRPDISADRTAVRIHITIDEGQPVVVEEVRFEGFDVLPDAARQQLDNAPLADGQPRDRNRVRASRDLAAGLLRDQGYPFAYVDAGERPLGDDRHVRVTFRADPGERMAFGDTTIEGLEHVRATVVRRQIAYRPGDVFRESAILRTQRRIGTQEVFELVAVTPQFDESSGGRVPMRITVAEGKPRLLRFGVGYGTEERARGSFSWHHLNLFGTAQHFEADASASFLSQTLNVSYVNPYLGHPRLSLTVTGVAENVERLSYDSQSFGGRAIVRYRFQTGERTSAFTPHRYDIRAGYRNEYLRYGISADSLGDLTQRDERIALGLDPDTGRGQGTLAALTLEFERAAVDDPIEPRRGTIASVQLEHAATWLGGTYRYNELFMDGRAYLPIGSSVFAAHAEAGVVAAADPATVPFSKRYFLGGATTLRGWGRFQVAPLDAQGLPIGGRTLLAGSLEWRFPITGKLSGVAFVDAGDVGSSDFNVDRLQLKYDVGPGLRYQTPIGALRADLGYQLTPIDGLRINGQVPDKPRRWRVHVSIGQAF